MSKPGMKKSPEQIKEEQKARGYNSYKKNLIPLQDRTPEEQKAIRQAGQKAMMEVKKKRKTIKEVMEMVTGLDVSNIATEFVDEGIVQKAREVDATLTAYDLIGLAQLQKALEGSTKSAEFIRDSNGEKPKDVQQIDVDIITESDRAMLENINRRLDSIEAIPTEYTDDL